MDIQFPNTIESVNGEKIIFLRMVNHGDRQILEVENEVKPNSGPPMHIHHRQEESLTVVSGKIGYQELHGEKKYAGIGETVTFKPGVAHKFWNAGDDLLRCKGYITPPDNIIFFLTTIYQSTNENNGRPGLYDSAYLLNRYKSEFGMVEIPAFVQQVLFPIALFFGNLSGKDKKFKGAPEPVK